ncbi:interleukin-15 receptor subunit alpha-like protein [Amazona aestiva]|uniref:Interleukin-15 receptor subunit alpha-like protein n=1 Tax=Amazona aestiva TaxID=12930 RepID=A0A0Q3RRD1_AMAAE|nr:interleukin-15 receptor subunit alpha-like protein [Amazona aestiva]
MQCSRPKDVANAHIDVGNTTPLNTRLRYTCNPGYKRKAGTSSLIQCILRDDSSEPAWTHTTLQCILSIQALASSIGLSVLLVAGIVACCCWRMRMCTGQSSAAAVTAIPMVPVASENEEMLPPSVYPMG